MSENSRDTNEQRYETFAEAAERKDRAAAKMRINDIQRLKSGARQSKLTEAQNDELQQLSALFISVFATPNGRLVMAHMDKLGYYKKSTFNPDPMIAAKLGGMRDLLIIIHDILEEPYQDAR